MARRKLPILVEHSLSDVAGTRLELAAKFRETTERSGPVSCRSGCAHCCYHPVHVSIFEALLLYRHLVSSGRWTPSLRAKLTEHADTTRDLAFEIWLLSMLACPFLDANNKCSVYAQRPFACRVTLSQGDSYLCHPHRVLNSQIVSKTDITREFHKRQRVPTRRHDLTLIIMPLSVALLIAERIERGEVDLEATDMAVLQDYVERT